MGSKEAGSDRSHLQCADSDRAVYSAPREPRAYLTSPSQPRGWHRLATGQEGQLSADPPAPTTASTLGSCFPAGLTGTGGRGFCSHPCYMDHPPQSTSAACNLPSPAQPPSSEPSRCLPGARGAGSAPARPKATANSARGRSRGRGGRGRSGGCGRGTGADLEPRTARGSGACRRGGSKAAHLSLAAPRPAAAAAPRDASRRGKAAPAARGCERERGAV